MPTALTFTSLQVDLRRYLERGTVIDTTVYDQLPRLINLAEREIARALKIQGFITNVLGNLVAGTSVYQKPDRWRETISMNFGAPSILPLTGNNRRVSVFPRSYEYVREYWPDSNERGIPEFYADYNYTHWIIVPTPIANYPWEINYWGMPALLDITNQTNWLTDYAPGTLLYRCLLEATPFLKNDDRIAVWQNMYSQSLAALNGEDLQKVVDRSVTRQGA